MSSAHTSNSTTETKWSSEELWREISLSGEAVKAAPGRKPKHADDRRHRERAKRSRLIYQERKAIGLCTVSGCPEKAQMGHIKCRKHLQRMAEESKQRYRDRSRKALCIYCGDRPPFHGVRCVICRQKFAKDPLPFGVRRTLRRYREAEERRDVEQSQVEVKYVVRKLLASGEIKGRCAEAIRLYTGTDDGKWRTYDEMGRLMNISKERVRQLLRPSKLVVARMLNDRVPWKSMGDIPRRNPDSSLASSGQMQCCDKPGISVERVEHCVYESLPEVVLIGVSISRCQNCQTEVSLIPHQQELDSALAQRVLLKRASMSGSELRFLRKTAHLTIEALAELLGITRATLIGWEGSGALRYTNDLTARITIASIVYPDNGPNLINQILRSIRIGNIDLQPMVAQWSDVAERWIIEFGTL